ncbi:MAG: hypothetical protein R8N50_02540 [Alphaproteobacteria bacterium]|nr:hypothetical protein [Alphaproteobacteria bacterium]
MRFLFAIFCVLVTVGNVWAQRLLTSCPAGYITIPESGVVLADEKGCPASTKSLSTVSSCSVETPSVLCAMYAEQGEVYTDEKGTFMYQDGICEM